MRYPSVRQVTDDRLTKFPVTFALETIMMREHNRCCEEDAEGWGAVSEEVSKSSSVYE